MTASAIFMLGSDFAIIAAILNVSADKTLAAGVGAFPYLRGWWHWGLSLMEY